MAATIPAWPGGACRPQGMARSRTKRRQMRRLAIAMCALVAVAGSSLARASEPLLHTFDAAVISPDGRLVASVEGVDAPDAALPPPPALVIRAVDGRVVRRVAPCGAV